LGTHKDFTFNFFVKADQLITSNKWILNNKVHLRANYKNAVISAGFEDWDLHDKLSGRLPKVFSLNSTYIHDLNNETRLYTGFNASVNIIKKTNESGSLGYGYVLGGFNYLRKHKLIAIIGCKTCDVFNENNLNNVNNENNEKEDINTNTYINKLSTSLRLMGNSKFNDSIDIYSELNINKDANSKQGLTIATQYKIDSKTKLKAKIDSNGELIMSYLHNYGVWNFGFNSRVYIIYMSINYYYLYCR